MLLLDLAKLSRLIAKIDFSKFWKEKIKILTIMINIDC